MFHAIGGDHGGTVGTAVAAAVDSTARVAARPASCPAGSPRGTRLGEADLAEQLAVSRTPVREALSRLAAEGLVDLVPEPWRPGGARGRPTSCARSSSCGSRSSRRSSPWPCRGSTAGRLDELRRARPPHEAARAAPGRRQDLDAIVELNREFHGLLSCTAADNAALAASLRTGHARRRRPPELPGLRRRLAGPQPRPPPRDGRRRRAPATPTGPQPSCGAHLHNARATMLQPRADERTDRAGPRRPHCRSTTCGWSSSASCWPGRSAVSCSATSAPR